MHFTPWQLIVFGILLVFVTIVAIYRLEEHKKQLTIFNYLKDKGFGIPPPWSLGSGT